MYFFTGAVVDAVLTVGSRVLLTPGVIAAPGLGPPRQLGGDARRHLARIDRDGLRFGPGERIELGYGPHAAYTLPPEALRSVAEPPASGAHCCTCTWPRRKRRTPRCAPSTARCRRCWTSSACSTAAGCLLLTACNLSDDEIGLLAARRVAVSHCPGSNAKLAAGVAARGGAAAGRGAGGARDGRAGLRGRPGPLEPGPAGGPLGPGDQRRTRPRSRRGSCC